MLESQFRFLHIQWEALRVAAAKWRKDDGVTTLEVVILASVLLVAAAALAVTFQSIWTNRKANLPTS